MELNTAIKLIEKGVEKTAAPQAWADLGAGSGLFSRALSTLLRNGSVIYAVDKNRKSLAEIVDLENNIVIKKVVKDFTALDLDLEAMDGILMANALHFVPEPSSILSNFRRILKPSGRIILIEYDSKSPTQWVPYPVSFERLKLLGSSVGFTSMIKLSELPSLYNQAPMYAALLK